MDKDGFWQAVVDETRHHKQRSHPVEQLPKEKMEQLESNVYAHIDQLFSDSEMTDSEVMPATVESEVSTTANSQHKHLPEQSSSLWARLFKISQTPFFVMAMIALLSVGVLAYLFSGNRVSEPLFDIPESVVVADVDRYIPVPQQNSRALTGTLPSMRRSAFLAGVTQADLDLIDDIETPAAHQIALWYHETITGTPTVNARSALETVRSNVARYVANKQSRFWLKHGYAVEMVHLAAKHSMSDLNVSALEDALVFYRAHTLVSDSDQTEPTNPELKIGNADIARQYILNHEKLEATTLTNEPTPEQLQEIIDITHDMKVLIQ